MIPTQPRRLFPLLLLALVALYVLFVIKEPTKAAHLTTNVVSGIAAAAESLTAFLGALG
ncbi:hypothetical protein Aple_073650 [Acrocarpospora pleiomorpha]|uniref:Uncharacterized protein n=1 Tax=Acrocarpospora pleiomorpha TaxID=90975 RepID=A0A5M3XUA1_9ACTN|nr:hypothetical protein [Acrocarpospora pleiomorpha]GES24466.1 hypothetical protein Aple_073650 [Acrocarpospora pleiomorpha]